MAVEPTHLNLFLSQLIQHRNLLPNQGVNFYNNEQQMRYSGFPNMGLPLPSGFNDHTAVCDLVLAKPSVNTDVSGLTYNIPAPTSRKRPRDQLCATAPNNHFHVSPQKSNISVSQLPSFVGQEFLPQIQQHQLEIDAIISQHTKKIRLEVEEGQKQQARLVSAAIGEGVVKKLKEKDEQIQRMSKLNFVLQERVKSLYVENQLWRDLAQSNEATANSLRTNLEQVMAHVSGGEERISAAESCCGSSDHGRELAENNKEVEGTINLYSEKVRCKSCGEREPCVLLLPCRHLCLCSVCGSGGSQQLQACPVCNSTMNATVRVNMSSSG